MTESAAEQGGPVDILEAAEQAESDVVQQREESLAKQLAEMKSRKRRLVDPLQFELSIQAEDLAGYTPAFGWEIAPPSEKQLGATGKVGHPPDEIECAGQGGKAARPSGGTPHRGSDNAQADSLSGGQGLYARRHLAV